MGNDRLDMFYERLVVDAARIPPVLQMQIVRELLRSGRFAALSTLAARDDLCAPVDALLAGCDDPQVLGAWLSRPGRTDEALAARLQAVPRTSTLCSVAALPDLPDDVYRALGRFAPRSARLTEALAANPSVPPQVKVGLVDAIVDLLDRHAGTDRFATSELGEISGGDPALLHGIVERSGNVVVLAAAFDVLGHDAALVPDETAAALIERLDGLLDAFLDGVLDRGPALTSPGRDGSGSVQRLLARLACRELAAEHVAALTGIVARLLDAADDTAAARDPFRQVLRLLEPPGRALVGKISRLAVTDEIDEARALCAELLVSPFGALPGEPSEQFRYVTLRAIVSNQVLPAEVVVPLVDDLEEHVLDRLVATWDARGDVSALARVAAGYWTPPAWLDALTDPLAVVQEMLKVLAAEGISVPSWVSVHRLLADPVTAIALLPWKCLVDATPQVLDAAQTMIVERLGDDRSDNDRLDAFTVLAREFDGTLPELLDLVVALDTPPR